MTVAAAPTALTDRSPLPGTHLDEIAADAARVDAERVDLRPAVRRILTGGGLHRGTDGVATQAAVIAEVAGRCMSTAFSLWGHRMAVEYLDRFGGPEQSGRLADVVAGVRPGVSAMGASFKHLAQLRAGVPPAGLGIRARRDDSGGPGGTDLILDGFAPYATNLHPDAVVVIGAHLVEENGVTDVVLAIDLDQPGVEVREATDLLALNSTTSGSVRLDGVRVPATAVLPTPFEDLVGGVRGVFLVLQSAFCLGHAAGSLAHADGPGGPFADEIAARRADQDRLAGTLGDLATGAHAAADHTEYLRVRLESMEQAQASAQLALCLTGGRGYARTHPVARGLREAAFLPVQAPTKGQLLWELQSLNSAA
ncbi:acyl-CoA dehydrogenase family protein [Occultella glacieicola]|uniref:acyl-CoA dehydrogenase n=1 Tax=Occultella glacieicola TaxID=2518684 RepID=UPI00140446F7|nr:acyl-CoA dehydrogenase [Occultella glacieicola]